MLVNLLLDEGKRTNNRNIVLQKDIEDTMGGVCKQRRNVKGNR